MKALARLKCGTCRASAVALVVIAGLGAAPVTRPPPREANRPATAPAPATRPAMSHPEPGGFALGDTPIRRRSRPPTAAADAANSTGVAGEPASVAAAPASPASDFPRVAGALAIVLGLIFALRFLLRRSLGAGAPAGATGAMQVVARSTISPRQQLLLLRVGRKLIVVGDSNGQLSALTEVTDADEVAALIGQLRDEKLTAASRSFGGLLSRLRHDPEAAGPDADVDAAPDSAPDLAPNLSPNAAAPDGDGSSRPRIGLDGDPGDVPRAGDAADDSAITAAREEIQGLLKRVRSISGQFNK